MPQTMEVQAPNGKTLTITGDHVPSEAELHDIFAKAGVDTTTQPPASPSPRAATYGALAAAAGAKALPLAGRAVEELATNPNVPAMAAKAGRVIGGIAPVVGGAIAGAESSGPLGAVGGATLGLAGAAKGAWAGGKTGWFTGKLAQQVAGPLADVFGRGARLIKVISDAAPMLGAFSAEGEAIDRLNSPDSMLAIAQHSTAAERTKLAGIVRKSQPETANAILQLNRADPDKDVASVKKLIEGGTPPAAAVKQVAGEDPSRFGSLMTLYLRSRQVK